LPDEPFERVLLLLAPLLELPRALLPADLAAVFAFDAFGFEAFAFEAFDFDFAADDLTLFGADRFLAFAFV